MKVAGRLKRLVKNSLGARQSPSAASKAATRKDAFYRRGAPARHPKARTKSSLSANSEAAPLQSKATRPSGKRRTVPHILLWLNAVKPPRRFLPDARSRKSPESAASSASVAAARRGRPGSEIFVPFSPRDRGRRLLVYPLPAG